MPIIGKVGQKSFKVRFLNISIHSLLLIGSLTMIYPFLMMISASFKSEVDSSNFSVIPKFFHDDSMLHKKFIESRLNEQSNQLIERYRNRFIAFSHIDNIENIDLERATILQDYINETKDNYGLFDYGVAEQHARGVYPKNERGFREYVQLSSGKSIEKFNKIFNANAKIWDDVKMEEKNLLSRSFNGKYEGMQAAYLKYRAELPTRERVYFTLDGNFIATEILPNYRNDIKKINKTLETNYASLDDIILSPTLPEGKISKHWISYVKKSLNFNHIGLKSDAKPSFLSFLQDRYGDIKLLNRTYETNFGSFEDIDLNRERFDGSAEMTDYGFYIENLANPADLVVKSFEIDYRNYLKKRFGTLNNYYKEIESDRKSFTDITFKSEYPTQNYREGMDWYQFITEWFDDIDIELKMISQADYITFLKKRYPTLEELNRDLGKDYDRWINIYPSKTKPTNRDQLKVWREFALSCNPQYLSIDNERYQEEYQNFLAIKYDNIDSLNYSYGYIKRSFDKMSIDYLGYDYLLFTNQKSEIFWEMVKRNYIMVLDAMLYNGRAIYNTLIYCLLAILTAIFINPLAAYAMSRFKFRSNYKIILILMLTMAFPPMVMGIPNFLMLKNMNLLNTFWALILPAAADGYFIFLLKGFFDSLPKELFESATIDGASETRIFLQIAMALSKPIMAVIALGAFNGAYRNFMFAFLVCQDNSMWTMMVHIYQIIQRSSSGVGFAALVIASIPTFFVFVFFQNIIIKGIVVPTEK